MRVAAYASFAIVFAGSAFAFAQEEAGPGLHVAIGSMNWAPPRANALELGIDFPLADGDVVFRGLAGSQLSWGSIESRQSRWRSRHSGGVFAGFLIGSATPAGFVYMRPAARLSAVRTAREEAEGSWGSEQTFELRLGAELPVGSSGIFFEGGLDARSSGAGNAFMVGARAPLHGSQRANGLPEANVSVKFGEHSFAGLGWRRQPAHAFRGDAAELGVTMPFARGPFGSVDAVLAAGAFETSGEIPTGSGNRLALTSRYGEAGLRVTFHPGARSRADAVHARGVHFFVEHGIGAHHTEADYSWADGGRVSTSRVDPSLHVLAGTGLWLRRWSLSFEIKRCYSRGRFASASEPSDMGGVFVLLGVGVRLGRVLGEDT